jgi:hypothetical protein
LLVDRQGTHRPSNLDNQAGLDLQLLSMGQSKVGKDIARATLNLDALWR